MSYNRLTNIQTAKWKTQKGTHLQVLRVAEALQDLEAAFVLSLGLKDPLQETAHVGHLDGLG